MARNVEIKLMVDADQGIIRLADFEKAVAKVGTTSSAGAKGPREMGEAVGFLDGSLSKLTSGAVLGGFASAVAGAFAVDKIKAFVEETQKAHREMEATTRVFTVSAGSSQAAGQQMDWLRGIASQLGQNFYTLADASRGFYAASQSTSIAGQVSRDVLESVTMASTALGLSSDQTKGALLSLTQMMSKGTVQAEELRGQLGERVPGAFGDAARAMGMTEKELGKALEKGDVLATDLLPRLATLWKEKYGAAATGAANSSQAAFNMAEEASKNLSTAIGDRLAPAYDALLRKQAEFNNLMAESIRGTISFGDALQRLANPHLGVSINLADAKKRLAALQAEAKQYDEQYPTGKMPAYYEQLLDRIAKAREEIKAFEKKADFDPYGGYANEMTGVSAAIKTVEDTAKASEAAITEATLQAQKTRLEAQRASLEKSLGIIEIGRQQSLAKIKEQEDAGKLTRAQAADQRLQLAIKNEADTYKARQEWGNKSADYARKLHNDIATAGLSRYEREKYLAQAQYEEDLKHGVNKKLAAQALAARLLKIEQDHTVSLRELQDKRDKERLKDIADYEKAEMEANARGAESTEAKAAKVDATYDDLQRKLMGYMDDRGISEEEYAQRSIRLEENRAHRKDLILAEARIKEIDYLLELAKADHDTLQIRALEYEKYVLGLKKTDLSREQQFQLASRKLEDINKSALTKMLEEWGNTDKLIEEGTKNTLQSVQQSFADIIGKGIKGEIKSLGDAWDLFCDAMVNVFAQTVAQMLSIWTLSNLASLFTDKPGASFTSLLSGGGGGGALGTASSALSLVSAAKTVGGWLGIGGSGAGLGGASGFAGPLAAEQAADAFATMIANGKTMEEALAAIGGGESGLLGGIKTAFDSAIASVKGFVSGADAAAVAAETGAAATEAASLGLTTSLAWVGGALAVGELLGKLTGGVGPVGAVMEMFSGGQGHTQGSARNYEQLSIDAIGRQSSGLDAILGSSNDLASGGFFSGRALTEIRSQVEDMRILGERAGLTKREVDLLTQGMAGLERQMIAASQRGNLALVESLKADMAALQAIQQQTGLNTSALGAMSGAFAQISQAADLLSPRISEIVNTGQAGMYTLGGAVQNTAASLVGLADSLGLPREATEALKAKVEELVTQWNHGDMTAETLAATLQNQFVLALRSAALAGYDLKAVLEEIPREIGISVSIRTEGEMPSFDGNQSIGQGDAGDMPHYDVGGLVPRTEPALVHAGELIVTRENTRAILSGQAYLGQAPAAAQSAYTFAPQVNVDLRGAVFGSDPEVNARAIDRRVRATLREMSDRGEVLGTQHRVGVAW